MRPRREAFSLLELMAAVVLVGVLAAIALPRVTGTVDAADVAVCRVHRAEIEVQARRWRQANGGWPASNLADIGIDNGYFPSGVPTCPFDGSSYTLDADGRVVGHAH